MKRLIVYDSVHGNTEKIAGSIAATLTGEVEVLHVREINLLSTEAIDIIVVGSPTHGGRPTPLIQDFLNNIPSFAGNTRAAAFDTRLSTRWVGIFGYAADKIAASLVAKGATLALPPQGFLVKDTKGPLCQGELERASSWLKTISF